MKTSQTLLLPLAIALICVACGGKQSTQKSSAAQSKFPIHIQLPESHEYKNTLPFTLKDIVADIRYIPLETTPDCLIGGGGNGARFSKEYIFIATGGILLQFDRQGKFIRKINKRGKGPGECYVWNYGIDEKNRLIYIFDSDYCNIHTFTLDGEYVRTLRDPFSGKPDLRFPDGFAYDKVKGNFIFTGFQDGQGNESYKYVVTNITGTILYKSPNYAQYHLRRPSNAPIGSGGVSRLYRYDSSYYYHYEYNDTIFVINEDYTCSPAYVRHLPNRKTIEDEVEVSGGVKTPADSYGKNFYSRSMEDGRYLYLFHSHTISREEGIGLLSLYEKATGTLIENINPNIPLLNNWDGGKDVPLYDYYPGEHQNYLMLDPYKLKETLTAEHFAGRKIAHPDKAEALKKLVSTLKEDDNPVLMIITMKK